MIQFRKATEDDIELLVTLRIRDLKMFSFQEIQIETINQIRLFYQKKMKEHYCETILGYDQEYLVATATLYQYDVMPSNKNPYGKVGQLTNVWVHDHYHHQGLATEMIQYFIKNYQNKVGMICLNSSLEAVSLYEKQGFQRKGNYFVFYTE
ncbi:GNAT family N-acetyltransferase [Candidatus Stoquefichus massiliensis]|uniref:GNAT family N-acetyltransferase n=1 Tax=Candidatus Stoquefichus massiliensis TaxID=1470350 RepID=UPI0004B77D2C|nr:GNAT family N-acetyltransferase [Candidatus Stoquefichus massiliensis]